MPPRFFRTPAQLRRWLRHHGSAAELPVGFHKRTSGRPGSSWPQSVDEALCFGWIDGVRHHLDAQRYAVRFSPRRAGSTWSARNIATVTRLRAAGRMQAAGLAAYAGRRRERSAQYSYEQPPRQLPAPYARLLARHTAAARFFAAEIPSYRRAAIWWVVSAKKAQTRHKRLARLIELCARGERIPQFIKPTRAAPRRRP